MRVLVCGGRDYLDKFRLERTLDIFDSTHGPFKLIITGGARGADTLAHEWAVARGIPTQVFEAKWDKYGNAAGPFRNQEMLEVGRPDLVIAFRGGRGTADMVQRAKFAGVKFIDCVG